MEHDDVQIGSYIVNQYVSIGTIYVKDGAGDIYLLGKHSEANC